MCWSFKLHQNKKNFLFWKKKRKNEADYSMSASLGFMINQGETVYVSEVVGSPFRFSASWIEKRTLSGFR